MRVVDVHWEVLEVPQHFLADHQFVLAAGADPLFVGVLLLVDDVEAVLLVPLLVVAVGDADGGGDAHLGADGGRGEAELVEEVVLVGV